MIVSAEEEQDTGLELACIPAVENLAEPGILYDNINRKFMYD